MIGKEDFENQTACHAAENQAKIQAQYAAAAGMLHLTDGLLLVNAQVVVAENGFVLATPDQYGSMKKFSIAPTVAELEGLMRQWLDIRISEIKEWDNQRKCSRTSMKKGPQS